MRSDQNRALACHFGGAKSPFQRVFTHSLLTDAGFDTRSEFNVYSSANAQAICQNMHRHCVLCSGPNLSFGEEGVKSPPEMVFTRNFPRPHASGLKPKLILACNFVAKWSAPEWKFTRSLSTEGGFDTRSKFNVGNSNANALARYLQSPRERRQAKTSHSLSFRGLGKVPSSRYLLLASPVRWDATQGQI